MYAIRKVVKATYNKFCVGELPISYDENQSLCRYLSKDGKQRCPIGTLFGEGHIPEKLEGLMIDSVLYRFPILIERLIDNGFWPEKQEDEGEFIRFLITLQRWYDLKVSQIKQNQFFGRRRKQ